jgi:hypothetical protein
MNRLDVTRIATAQVSPPEASEDPPAVAPVAPLALREIVGQPMGVGDACGFVHAVQCDCGEQLRVHLGFLSSGSAHRRSYA